VPAQCGNSARLTINGEYYGLYTNLERLDKEFLQRTYGDDDEGDLWKGATFIKTNKEDPQWQRLETLWAVTTLDELAAVSDLEEAVRVWAAEAMVSHGDGYYNGRANFFVYDHPTREFVWLPHDLDSAFDFLPAEMSPLFPSCVARWFSDRHHWALVMADVEWQAHYVDLLASARELYEVGVLEGLIDRWSAQIHDAAADDRMKPFSTTDHVLAIDHLRSYPRARAARVDEFLDCRESGGPDDDGDGFDVCFDCDDGRAAANPGATETCNGLDDDCDGQIDELPGGTKC
jgi:hypothetical protein